MMTSPTQLPPQSDPHLDSRLTLPTMYDLPSEDPEEPGLPDTFHLQQSQLLDITFCPPNWDVYQVFTAIDLYLYYDANNTGWYKRPDWFAVVGVPNLYEGRDMRLSYVIWQELVSPMVVVELLSPGTEAEDLGETVRQLGRPPTKWEVYEQILQVPYYIVFSRYTNILRPYRLVEGYYEPAELTEGRLLIPEIELSLGLWQGAYKDINRLWLRWFTASGELIPTPQEQTRAAQEQTRTAQEQARIAGEQARAAQEQARIAEEQARSAQEQTRAAQEQARSAEEQTRAAQEQTRSAEEQARAAEEQAAAAVQRTELLAAHLRELGIDPDQFTAFGP